MQKAFEKIIEKVKAYYDAVNPYVGNSVTKIVNQVAEKSTEHINCSTDDLISRSVLIDKLKKWKSANEERGYDTAKDLVQEMIELVKEQEPVGCDDSWIPCSKQLPSEKENPITNDYMQYPVMVNINGTVDLRYYYYGDGHWRYGFEIKDKYVTHWMDIKPYQPKICVNTECPYNENAECPAAEGSGGFEQK